jgi:hypothetical protein
MENINGEELLYLLLKQEAIEKEEHVNTFFYLMYEEIRST